MFGLTHEKFCKAAINCERGHALAQLEAGDTSAHRVYHAGDTDAIPEMRDVRCDVALLPVSGTYVMTADEALEAVGMIEAAAVVPMHFGDIVGSEADAARLKELSPIPVEILPRSRP